MRRLFFAFSIFILITFFVSCARIKPVMKELQPAQPSRKSLTIVFTNSTMGAFEPEGCGCMHRGGFARRAHFIRDARERYPSLMVFDTGNTLFERPALPETGEITKADYMLASLNQMKIDALNIAAQDCGMGSDYIKAKEKDLVFPLLSANLRSRSTGSLILSPYVIKDINNIKIGIFGLVGGYDNTLKLRQKDIFIESPLTSAQKAVEELKGMGCSLIMLLSQLSHADNKRIARQVSGIHFILGSSSKSLLHNPKIIDSTAILSPGTRGTHVAVLELDFENDSAPFFNDKQREAVMERIEELKDKEENPETSSALEEVVLKRVLMEEKLKSFEGKNSYRYSVFALDRKVKDDRHVGLLVEKYKEGRLRQRLPSYKTRIPAVDVSSLSEEKRLMALRLMNEIACDEEGSIADSAAKAPFCRKLALMIVDSIKKGESEGKIRYSILYEKEKLNAEKLKISLDKDMQLQ
jgi:hypothetical protein